MNETRIEDQKWVRDPIARRAFVEELVAEALVTTDSRTAGPLARAVARGQVAVQESLVEWLASELRAGTSPHLLLAAFVELTIPLHAAFLEWEVADMEHAFVVDTASKHLARRLSEALE